MDVDGRLHGDAALSRSDVLALLRVAQGQNAALRDGIARAEAVMRSWERGGGPRSKLALMAREIRAALETKP